MLEFSELESDEDEPSKPSSKPRRPQDKAQGYPRSECFRVEKNLLVYGSVACSCVLLQNPTRATWTTGSLKTMNPGNLVCEQCFFQIQANY